MGIATFLLRIVDMSMSLITPTQCSAEIAWGKIGDWAIMHEASTTGLYAAPLILHTQHLWHICYHTHCKQTV